MAHALQTLPEATTLLPVATRPRRRVDARRAHASSTPSSSTSRLVLGIFLIVFLGSAIAALIASEQVARVEQGAREDRRDGAARAGRGAVAQHQHAAQPGGREDRSRHREELPGRRGGGRRSSGSSPSRQRGRADRRAPGRAHRDADAGHEHRSQISFIGKNPENAARFVNAITDLYIDHHNKVYRREGLNQFYSEQLRMLESQMKAAQEQLRATTSRRTASSTSSRRCAC